MAASPAVNLNCTRETFHPVQNHPVRWLDWEADFTRAQEFAPEKAPLTRKIWDDSRRDGYRFCAIIEDEKIIAWAAAWRYSEKAWEVAAVRTHPEYRRRGYGQTVVSFVTDHILKNDRLATCLTRSTNEAMQKTAMSVGFVRGPRPDQEK